jgi:hypothetical protein
MVNTQDNFSESKYEGTDNYMRLVVGAKPQTGAIFTIEGNHRDRVDQVSRNYRAERLRFTRLSGDR